MASIIGEETTSIVATMRVQPPFSYRCVLFRHEEDCNPAGVNADIFKAVMLFMGIDYELIRAEDDTTGYQLPNGTWRGMIGQLMRGEAQMTASLIGVDEHRLKVIDYSAPVSYFDNGFIVHKDTSTTGTGRLLTFLFRPLSVSTWYSLVVSLAVIIGLVYVANRVVLGQRGPNVLADACFGVTRALLRQTVMDPPLNGLRILLTSWEIALFFVAAFYSAHLTSSLMVSPKIQNPFNGMDQFSEMVYNKQFTVISTDKREKWRIRANDTKSSTFAKLRLASKWNPPVFVDNMKRVVQEISSNSSLVYFGSLYQLMDATADSCDLMIIEDKFTMPKWLSFGFPKGSALTEWISLSLHTDSFSVNSYLQRLYRRYAKKRSCAEEDKSSSSYIAMSLEQLQGAFIVLFLGIFFALLLCAVEKLLIFMITNKTKSWLSFGTSNNRAYNN